MLVYQQEHFYTADVPYFQPSTIIISSSLTYRSNREWTRLSFLSLTLATTTAYLWNEFINLVQRPGYRVINLVTFSNEFYYRFRFFITLPWGVYVSPSSLWPKYFIILHLFCIRMYINFCLPPPSVLIHLPTWCSQC